jgi:hypothetical protein
MTDMRMEDLIEHFSTHLQSALTKVLQEEAPGVDANRIFAAFKRAAVSRLEPESVSDGYTSTA